MSFPTPTLMKGGCPRSPQFLDNGAGNRCTAAPVAGQGNEFCILESKNATGTQAFDAP